MQKPTYVYSSSLLECPDDIAVCSKCGDKILITIHDWETISRKVTGITIECKSESWNDRTTWHPRWGSDWYRTTNAVLDWMNEYIRIDPEP